MPPALGMVLPTSSPPMRHPALPMAHPLNLHIQLPVLDMDHLLFLMRLLLPHIKLLNLPTVLLNLPTVLLNLRTMYLNPPTVLPVIPSRQLRQVIMAVELLIPTSTITTITALTRSQSTAGRRLSSSRASSWRTTTRSRGTLRALCPWNLTLAENPPPAVLASGSQGREAAEI